MYSVRSATSAAHRVPSHAGRSGQRAVAILPWGAQQIPICSSCEPKLKAPEPATAWCRYNELYSLEFRDQAPAGGVVIETRLTPAVESLLASGPRKRSSTRAPACSGCWPARSPRGSKRRRRWQAWATTSAPTRPGSGWPLTV